MNRWIIFLILIISSSYSYAYKVEPMVAEMEPIGRRAQMTMRIDNTSKAPLTVELYASSMTMDKFGTESMAPADDELLVIPVTAIIPPGRSQAVMVRYLGAPNLKESKSYRVSVKQVKVDNGQKNAAQMGILLQFNTLINIRPKNTMLHLMIEEIKQEGKSWALKVTNSGDSYGRLTNTNWRVSDGQKSSYIKSRDITKLISGSLVLPHSTRYIKMNPLEGFDLSHLFIEIEKDE